MTAVEVVNLVTYLQDFYGVEYNPRQVDMLVGLFAREETRTLEAARNDLCASLKWLPKPAEIRDAVEKVRSNNGRGVVVNDDPLGAETHSRLAWAADELYGRALRGEISGAELEASKEYRWWIRNQEAHGEGCPCRICRGEITEEELCLQVRELSARRLANSPELQYLIPAAKPLRTYA